MRLGARKARYLDVREVIVFGVISPPQHTGARRGVPLLGRFLRPGHWLSLTGAPVRWQGGRKARIKETPAQPRSFRRRCRRSPKEIQCVRDATLVFGPQRKAICLVAVVRRAARLQSRYSYLNSFVDAPGRTQGT